MRVLVAGACANAGAARVTAPMPSAAAPAAMKLRRSGLAGAAEQQVQLRKNFRADFIGFPSLPHGSPPRVDGS
jgi:hypothetical protein